MDSEISQMKPAGQQASSSVRFKTDSKQIGSNL